MEFNGMKLPDNAYDLLVERGLIAGVTNPEIVRDLMEKEKISGEEFEKIYLNEPELENEPATETEEQVSETPSEIVSEDSQENK